MIRVQGLSFELLENHREGWNPEIFKTRYSDILNKFDYIVGDWGYGQLRLKGFFEDHYPKATFDNRISFLDEYLQEYCNFGCPYFVLKKVKDAKAELIKEQPSE
ncbi:YutD family protein [Ammoniphilus sp. YIM 78166]|uniref:YutD family protein n=1 Tax=Ammoniphilus sp. YIM 78166 TaxID=1644106 RepID=UPI00106F398F|nr:YutD family protein [Ammoniphilus sp. YIM 78166]